MDDEESSGVPEWVVTYGDMMSLLLTFFIMLVSLSEVIEEKKYQAILDALQRYVGYQRSSPAPPGQNFPLNSLISSLRTTLGAHTDEERGHGGVKQESLEGEDIRVFRLRKGVPLPVGEMVLFSPGRAALSPRVRKRVERIAEELAGKPNKIEIRAHTSTPPLPPDCPFPDKFVLSYERGRRVLRLLDELGVERDRMRITAVADLEPLPESGDRQSVASDRVEVRLLDVFAGKYIGPREIGE